MTKTSVLLSEEFIGVLNGNKSATYHLFLLKSWVLLGRLGCVLAHLVQPGAAPGAEPSLIFLCSLKESEQRTHCWCAWVCKYLCPVYPCVPCSFHAPVFWAVPVFGSWTWCLSNPFPRRAVFLSQGKCLLWGVSGWPGSLWPGFAFVNPSWGELSGVQEAASRGSWSPSLQACAWPWLMLETLLKMPTLWKPWQMLVFFVSTRGWSGWRRWLQTETAWGVAQPIPSMTESLPGTVRRLIIQFGLDFSLQGGIV